MFTAPLERQTRVSGRECGWVPRVQVGAALAGSLRVEVRRKALARLALAVAVGPLVRVVARAHGLPRASTFCGPSFRHHASVCIN
jgi:hypothetical protein